MSITRILVSFLGVAIMVAIIFRVKMLRDIVVGVGA